MGSEMCIRDRFHYFAGFRRLIEAFYASIASDGPEPIPLEDMIRMADLQDRIWTQIAQSQPTSSPQAFITGEDGA